MKKLLLLQYRFLSVFIQNCCFSLRGGYSIIYVLLILTMASLTSFGNKKTAKEETEEAIKRQNQHRQFNLKTGQVYTIYVKKGTGTTTVIFPTTITGLSAVNIAATSSSASYQRRYKERAISEAFAVQIQPNSFYFSLSTLKENQTATLTVMCANKAYILYLKHDPNKAYSVVNFSETSQNENANSCPAVTPARLLSLLDMAKAYDILKKDHPEFLQDCSRSLRQSVFHFNKFDVQLLDTIRFNKEDTVIFKLLLKNKTKQEIKYDRQSFNAIIGNNVYYMSASDASGVIPASGQSFALFAITGNGQGFRNNLSVDNTFVIGLTAEYMLKKKLTKEKSNSKKANAVEQKKA